MAATDEPPRSLRSLPPEGAECRGSKSACADLDGTKAGRVSRLALAAHRRSRLRARPGSVWSAVWSKWRELVGGLLAGGAATAASGAVLPEDKAEALFHVYDGGGLRASGPALLVRKSLLDRVSLSGQVYVDAVSNASIDVVTSASPFKETRTAVDLGLDAVVRDATLSLGLARSTEPDYLAEAASVDVAHEVFGNTTTVSLGFTRGHDRVGKKGVQGWIDDAQHWQYRVGLTQILSPRWLVSVNAEAISDSGLLSSPYRAARVFGAAVPERNPRTRSSRAVKLRSVADTAALLPRSSLRLEYRYYWDTWDIKAHTVEVGGSRYLGQSFLLDVSLRSYRQGKAVFYSDDAQTETLYVSRNRQLSTFKSTALSARLSYTWPGLRAGYDLKLSGAYELKRFRYDDFTDLRTGGLYAHDAHVLQLAVTATF